MYKCVFLELFHLIFLDKNNGNRKQKCRQEVDCNSPLGLLLWCILKDTVFLGDFQKLTAADDKTAQVEDFLQFLYGVMAQDVIWQNASEEQLQDAQLAIERSVMNRIFKLAFYPNQDGDILRDQ